MLPPGRARLATTPVPTGSPADANTIGMTDVACLAARTGGVLCVRMTSTLSRDDPCRPVRDRVSPPRIWRRVELSGDLLQPLPPAPRIDTGGGNGEMGEGGIGEREHVHF